MEPITIAIVAGGVVGVVVITRIITRKKKEDDDKDERRSNISSAANIANDITRVKKGGVFMLPAFGPNKMPVETYVTACHRYEDEEGDEWYELACQHGARNLLVEWYREGRELIVTAGYEDENPVLEDLNLDADRLEHFDDEEEGKFRWDGTTFHYDDSGAVMYYENDGREGEEFYVWDFEDDSETRFISVEKWGRRKYEVYHLWEVDADDIEVYDAGSGK